MHIIAGEEGQIQRLPYRARCLACHKIKTKRKYLYLLSAFQLLFELKKKFSKLAFSKIKIKKETKNTRL